ncbi:hypothetical protein RFI_31071, partial [Reticulomyxa filosa]
MNSIFCEFFDHFTKQNLFCGQNVFKKRVEAWQNLNCLYCKKFEKKSFFSVSKFLNLLRIMTEALPQASTNPCTEFHLADGEALRNLVSKEGEKEKEKEKEEESSGTADESSTENAPDEEKEENESSVLNTMGRLKSMAVNGLEHADKMMTVPMKMMDELFDSMIGKEECKIDPRTVMPVIKLNLKPQGSPHESTCKIKGKIWTSIISSCKEDDEIFVIHDSNAMVYNEYCKRDRESAVTYDTDVSIVNQTSGITGGTLQIVSGLVVNPLKGASDLFVEPYQHVKADPSLESAGKGLLKGTKSLLMAPLNIIADTLGGTKKIVDGILDAPQAISNLTNGLKFNIFCGWTMAYSVSELNEFPGNIGDIIVIDYH